MSKISNRILLAGGGTGGHIYPLIAVAEEIKKQSSEAGFEIAVEFMGDSKNGSRGGTDIFREEAEKLGIKYQKIVSPKWRRYFSLENFIDLFKFPIGLIQALFHVWLFMPDMVFLKGGYASFLPGLAAKIFMIPLAIHESDAVPGKINLFFGKSAKKVFVSLEKAGSYFKSGLTKVVGNPIRPAVLVRSDQAGARQTFSLDPAKPTILIIGASQGSKIINDNLMLIAVELVRKFQIIHQTGPNNFKEVSRELERITLEGKDSYGKELEKNYRIYPSLDAGQMALAYSAADLVISRAGSSIFEIAAAGRPAVLIPLKISASGHQLANARELAKFGASVIEEDNLTPHILLNEIEKVYQNRSELGEKIRQFARPDSAAVIANYLLAAVSFKS